MLQDIFDREGNIIGSVETVRMETKYGDGRGHVVEVVVTDDLSMSDFRGMDLRNADFRGADMLCALFDRWKKEEMIYDRTTKFSPPPTYKPSFL